jgi:hypothetical protein
MEGPNKRNLEDFSPEERKKLVWMEMQAEMIKEYVLSEKDATHKWLEELNKILNESYEEFLPENNTDELKPYCFDFIEILRSAEQKLASEISENMKTFVGTHEISDKMIKEWREYIEEVKTVMIPRMKKLGVKDSVKLLEGAIMQSEIMMAHNE